MDAGSAGATTFEGFRKFAAEPAQTRLLCILNASMHGLASAGSTGGGGGGELDSLNQVQVEPLVKVIEENRCLPLPQAPFSSGLCVLCARPNSFRCSMSALRKDQLTGAVAWRRVHSAGINSAEHGGGTLRVATA